MNEKAKVTYIPPKFSPPLPQIIKAAAYCRVSTLQEIQHHSLTAQNKYYKDYICQHPGWIFVGIYSDQSSGRNNRKMRNFQRMLDDCRNGNIDFILVKSISRMGRNTIQFLNACYEFRMLNVDVYFEEEKLHICETEAIRMLTIYASLYQNESESKSHNIRWGIQAGFQSGRSELANRICYGYTKDVNGKLTPDIKKSEIVKTIFRLHSEGASLRDISYQLKNMGILSPRGKPTWSIETIRKILRNEKYYGNVLLQKTFVSNYFNSKQSENQGEYAKYLFENNHEAIIFSKQINKECLDDGTKPPF